MPSALAVGDGDLGRDDYKGVIGQRGVKAPSLAASLFIFISKRHQAAHAIGERACDPPCRYRAGLRQRNAADEFNRKVRNEGRKKYMRVLAWGVLAVISVDEGRE